MALGRNTARRILTGSKYTECVTILQTLAGARDDNGEFIAGKTVKTQVNASIENVGLQTLSLLRDNSIAGERIVDVREFFITTLNTNFIRPVRVGDVGQSSNDKIEYAGFTWDILRVEDFTNHGHIEIIAARIEGQSDAAATRNY